MQVGPLIDFLERNEFVPLYDFSPGEAELIKSGRSDPKIVVGVRRQVALRLVRAIQALGIFED